MRVAVPSCPVLLYAEPSSGFELRTALAEAGFDVTQQSLQSESTNGARVIVIDAGVRTDAALRLCHRLHYQADDVFVPIVFVMPADQRDSHRTALECGAAA